MGQKTTNHPMLRWLGRLLITLLGSTLLLLVALYILLRSPLLLERWVLPVAAQLAAPWGVTFSLNRLHIDLAGDITLHDLQLAWQRDEQHHLQLHLAALRLQFQPAALWQRRELYLTQLQIERLQLSGDWPIDSTTPTEPTAPAPLPSIPLRLTLADLQLPQIDLDVRLHQPQQQTHLQGTFGITGTAQLGAPADPLSTDPPTSAIPIAAALQLTAPTVAIDWQPLTSAPPNATHPTAVEAAEVDGGGVIDLLFSGHFDPTEPGAQAISGQLDIAPQITLNHATWSPPTGSTTAPPTLQGLRLHALARLERTPDTTWHLTEWLRSEVDELIVPTPFQLRHLSGKLQLTADSAERQALLNLTLAASDAAATPPPLSVTLNLDATEHAGYLQLQPAFQLHLAEHLADLDPIFQPLRQVGDQRWRGRATIQIAQPLADLTTVPLLTALDALPLTADWQLQLQQPPPGEQQTSTAAPPAAIHWRGPLQLSGTLQHAAAQPWHTTLNLAVDQLQLPEQPTPLPPIQLTTRQQWQLAPQPTLPLDTLSAQLQLADRPLLSLDLQTADQPQQWQLQGGWSLFVDPRWQVLLPPLTALQPYGTLQLAGELQLTLDHLAPTLLNLTGPPERLTLELNGSVQQPHAATALQIRTPSTFAQQITWTPSATDWRGRWQFPSLQLTLPSMSDSVSATDLTLNHQLQLHGAMRHPSAAQLELSIDANPLQLTAANLPDSSTTALTPLLPITLSLQIATPPDLLQLQQLQLTVADQQLKLALQGESDRALEELQVDAHLTLQPTTDQPWLPALRARGRLDLPLQLVLRRGRQLNLTAAAQFTQFDLGYDQLQLTAIDGQIPITQELYLTEDGALDFRYLLTADPFQRTDFARIEPYLSGSNTLQIAQIDWQTHAIGPLVMELPVTQNLIRLQQFQLALFGGYITGQWYLDLTPGSWQSGLLARVGGIDLRQLLPPELAAGAAHLPLSGRCALQFDPQRRLLEGRIDINDISRVQLLQLLDVLDPQRQDESFAQVRGLLRWAEPQQVALTMAGGLLDLSLTLAELATPITLRAIPLTPLLERYAGRWFDQLQQLPLAQPPSGDR